MSGVTVYSDVNYTGNSYTISSPGRYQLSNNPGPKDDTCTQIPFINDTISSFTISDDLIVILCDNATPVSRADFIGNNAQFTNCGWYTTCQPDLSKPTENNVYEFTSSGKTKRLIQDTNNSTTTIIVYKKENYDNNFCGEMVGIKPDNKCSSPGEPTKIQIPIPICSDSQPIVLPILPIVLGVIYGIMILSILILIFQKKNIVCPTC